MNMPWTLARQTALEAAKPLEAVEVALAEAAGFALASGVQAFVSQPSCDTSAMDGYAVRGPGPWTVVGRVTAGDPVPGVRIGAGEAFAVATGAPVPDGSDLVIPVELCSVEGTRLIQVDARTGGRHRGCDTDHRPGGNADLQTSGDTSHQPSGRTGHQSGATTNLQPSGQTGHQSGATTNLQPGNASRRPGATNLQLGKHIRRRGEDWSAGDELVPAGSLVTAAVLGLAAGAGHDTLLVHRRPRVAVVVTGDELLHSGPPRPGRVRDAIGPMLPSLLTGADLLGTTHLRDDPAALADALSFDQADQADAVTFDQADVIVTCGATSVGPADHLRRVLADLDADILVSGVACRPGHPMLLAVLPDGRCVVGLPGNPFAALAAVLTLLNPLLNTLGGHTTRPPITTWLPDVGAHPEDTRLVPVTRSGVPVGHDRPGSLWGAALADAIAVVPPGHHGGEVELLTFASAS
ncbi:hypothetical protein LFM09_11210 [Lentzea alba]|uniref:molybdopterin molybdotransferase MoeA n=1 Tax=Lentzea alba TaxID=2714351 RepID=UPI0039BF6A31